MTLRNNILSKELLSYLWIEKTSLYHIDCTLILLPPGRPPLSPGVKELLGRRQKGEKLRGKLSLGIVNHIYIEWFLFTKYFKELQFTDSHSNLWRTGIMSNRPRGSGPVGIEFPSFSPLPLQDSVAKSPTSAGYVTPPLKARRHLATRLLKVPLTPRGGPRPPVWCIMSTVSWLPWPALHSQTPQLQPQQHLQLWCVARRLPPGHKLFLLHALLTGWSSVCVPHWPAVPLGTCICVLSTWHFLTVKVCMGMEWRERHRREAGKHLGLGCSLQTCYRFIFGHTWADWCVLPGLSLGPSSIRGILFISFYPIQAESSTRKELGS